MGVPVPPLRRYRRSWERIRQRLGQPQDPHNGQETPALSRARVPHAVEHSGTFWNFLEQFSLSQIVVHS